MSRNDVPREHAQRAKYEHEELEAERHEQQQDSTMERLEGKAYGDQFEHPIRNRALG
jgi:hypothetical protein